ncbi:MAG: PAS domain S-box protein [bacterium]
MPGTIDSQNSNEESSRNNLLLRSISMEILDAIHDAVFIHELDGKIIAVNAAFEHLYGHTAKDVQSLTVADLSKNSENFSHKEAIQHIQDAARLGEAEFDWLAKHKSGRLFWVSVKLSLANLQGEQRIIAVVRDIDTEKKAVLELQAAEEHFRSLFIQSRAIMFLLDPADNKTIIDANDQAVDFYGYPKDQLIGMPISNINMLSESEIQQKLIQASSSSGNCFRFPHRLASGEIRQVLVYPSPIILDGKNLIFSIVHDITDSLGTETELEQQIQRLQVLQETAKIVLDEDSLELMAHKIVKLLHHKLGFERCAIMYEGEKSGELEYQASIGLSEKYKTRIQKLKPWRDVDGKFTPQFINNIAEESGAELSGQALLEEGIQSVAFIPLVFAERLVGKLNFYSSHKGQFSQADIDFGQTIGDQIVSAIRRWNDEKNLRQSEELFRAVTEQSGEGVGLLNQQGEFVLANPMLSMITAFSRYELTQLKFDDLLVEVNGTHSFNALVGADPGYHEYIIKGLNGLIEVEVAGYSVIIGEDTYLLCIFHDATEKNAQKREHEKLELSVQHAQKLESLGVLSGGIAHDFNNLLTGILGNAGLLKEDLQMMPMAAECANEIEKSALQAAGLCKQLLAYSGHGKFEVAKVSINELIMEVSTLVDASISKLAEVNYQFEGKLPEIMVDRSQMHQVIMNLLLNASDALEGQAGEILVSTFLVSCPDNCGSCTNCHDSGWISSYASRGGNNEFVCISVKDSGTGMKKEVLEKIFDPFFTTKFTGRGLGLAAMQGIIKGHEGVIKVFSEYGIGSEFQILIPVETS